MSRAASSSQRAASITVSEWGARGGRTTRSCTSSCAFRLHAGFEVCRSQTCVSTYVLRVRFALGVRCALPGCWRKHMAVKWTSVCAPTVGVSLAPLNRLMACKENWVFCWSRCEPWVLSGLAAIVQSLGGNRRTGWCWLVTRRQGHGWRWSACWRWDVGRVKNK